MDNILKNPTFIAVVIGTLTYTYLSWRKKQNKKYKKKKSKSNNDLLYSFIVAIIVWFISYGYINYKCQDGQNIQYGVNLPTNGVNLPTNGVNLPTYRLVKELSESPKSFTLMNRGGGLVMPMTNNPLPDVFIDNF
jgi:hypothetical protein